MAGVKEHMDVVGMSGEDAAEGWVEEDDWPWPPAKETGDSRRRRCRAEQADAGGTQRKGLGLGLDWKVESHSSDEHQD